MATHSSVLAWRIPGTGSHRVRHDWSDLAAASAVISMCRVISCVVGRGCLLWPVCSLGKTLLTLSLLHSILQDQICLFLQVFLDFLLFHPVPYNEKDIFFGVLILKGLVGLHRTIQLQLFQCNWLGHRLGLPWYCVVCLGNEQRSFCHFWDCIQVLRLDSFVDHDDYSISSKGFLPTVVDLVVIWVKFTHTQYMYRNLAKLKCKVYCICWVYFHYFKQI